MRRLPLGPRFVFAGGMLLTAVATVLLAFLVRARNAGSFENATESTHDRLLSRLEIYATILRGTSGIFAATPTIDANEFRRYVRRLHIDRNYPGTQGIGFAARIAPGRVNAFVAQAHAKGHADFKVWPDTGDEHTAILFLEPLDPRNEHAIGYDMRSEPTRRRAMDLAADSGAVTMSGRVTLVQEITALKQPGFLIYVPVYSGGDVPRTLAERRATLVGWVYSPFRARDLFTGIFGTEIDPRVQFRVFDSPRPDERELLYDSDPRLDDAMARFHRDVRLRFGGREWLVQFASRPAFEREADRWLPTVVAILGTVVSLLLFAATRSQARARMAAERSEAARSRFYAAMSHELRTPLNAILGYNDLLLAGVYGHMPAEQERGIERSQTAARHLLELVNDVLDLSKIEAGKMDVEMTEVELAPLIEELTTTIRPLVEEHGGALVTECALPGGGVIHTDPRRVRQILLNLLSNAAKFGAGRPVRLRCLDRGERGVAIEVVDQGPGISPRDQRRIFEEFVQLPNVSSGGTGLGLPISRRLAELLGGALEVQSEVGKGSTFRLVLPRDSRGDAAA